jgi:hypothetical protein
LRALNYLSHKWHFQYPLQSFNFYLFNDIPGGWNAICTHAHKTTAANKRLARENFRNLLLKFIPPLCGKFLARYNNFRLSAHNSSSEKFPPFVHTQCMLMWKIIWSSHTHSHTNMHENVFEKLIFKKMRKFACHCCIIILITFKYEWAFYHERSKWKHLKMLNVGKYFFEAKEKNSCNSFLHI